jgi:hypothetical protein
LLVVRGNRANRAALEDNDGLEELRKLVERLEQRERELGRKRINPLKPASKRPRGGG